MLITNSVVVESLEIQKGIYLQKLKSPEIAEKIKPGQFLNIKVREGYYPLLRRPFSVCDVEDDLIHIMLGVYGEGTKILSNKKIGETVNILGPLGNGFNVDDDFDLAVFIAGGLGAAPFPYLTRKLNNKKEIISFVGGRSNKEVIKHQFPNILIATEDGSEGFKGNVVQLFENEIKKFLDKKIKVFACGPNGMLKSLSNLIKRFNEEGKNLTCEVSTESAMACGFGICQGCPIQDSHDPNRYLLVCKNGPVFNVSDIEL